VYRTIHWKIKLTTIGTMGSDLMKEGRTGKTWEATFSHGETKAHTEREIQRALKDFSDGGMVELQMMRQGAEDDQRRLGLNDGLHKDRPFAGPVTECTGLGAT
jgi:hypothetical protein